LRKTLLEVRPIRKNFLKHQFGEIKIYAERAEIGLRKAPNVPVFFFKREREEWKLDLVKSLPLILLGVENISRQNRQGIVQQAVYILEEVMGFKMMPEDIFD
jgi:hypothetical protein